MSVGLTAKALERFVKVAGERLSGDWVLMGGSVLLGLGIEQRVTHDIDVAGPRTATQEDTLVLMDIAEELGLPVEAINQAGAFFLHKQRGWEEQLVPLHTGTNATIFRPNATLYVRLKLARLSESDLQDCLAMLAFASENDFPPPNSKELLKAIESELATEPNQEKRKRLLEIKAAVGYLDT